MDLGEFLLKHDIHPARHEHPPVMTVEESLRLVPKFPGAKTKNLFLRDKKGRRHLLVTVPHDKAVDIDALAAVIGVNGLGFGSAERLKKYLGITPGSVSLFSLVNDKARGDRMRAIQSARARRRSRSRTVTTLPSIRTRPALTRSASAALTR